MRIASCPVCFERLPPDVVCCVNGHAICRGCKKTMTQCPTCRDVFVIGGFTLITQLLKALPYPCRNEGCPEILIDKTRFEDHEKLFCSHRLTACKCQWSGKLKDFIGHLETSNCARRGKVSTSTSSNIHDPSTWLSAAKNGTLSIPIWKINYGQLFIINITFDRIKDKTTFHYACFPNEKAMRSSFIVNNEFSFHDTKLIAETKLKRNLVAGTLESSFSIDTSFMQLLKNDNEKFTRTVTVKEIKN